MRASEMTVTTPMKVDKFFIFLSPSFRVDKSLFCIAFPVFRTFFATPANYLIIKYNILFLGVAKKIICILENL